MPANARTPQTVSVVSFEQFCKGCAPDKAGLFEYRDRFVVGAKQEGINILISLEDLWDFIEEDSKLMDVPKEELLLVFWVEEDSLIMNFSVITQEDLEGMQEEERWYGISSARKH